MEIVDETEVAESLRRYHQSASRMAKDFGVAFEQGGQPSLEDCIKATLKTVMVRFDLQP